MVRTVGMNKSIVKNVLREIRYSLGRYLAIVAIIALGVGFFAGLRVTRPAMLRTLDTYLDEQNMYDFRLLSTLGLTEADAEYLRTVEGVRDACGSVSLEAFTELDGSGDIEGTVITLRSVTKGINLLKLESGRMPERAGECVIDARLFDDDIIGTRVIISDENTDTVKESFTERELVIVGRVWSPYYLNIDRGNTSLGDGTVDTFVFLHPSGFTVDYYTEMFVDIDTDAEPYTEEYAEAVGGMTDRVSEALSHRADVRYEALLDEARAQIADGYAELDAAKAELENQRADVKSQLEKAEKELDSGLAQYESGLALFEQNRPLIDMLEPTVAHFASLVEETWSRLEKTENESERRELERQLEIYETQYGTVKSQLDGIMAMKTQLDEAYAKIESGRAELEEKRLEAEAAFLDAEKKIKDGEDELAKAEKSISDIPRAETYLLTREQNVGYVCFENDSSTVEGIARVFPVLFFLVAILVCMTTMTRMVDDQRTQIGTLKALGYSSTAVVSKYVAYSGSAALVGAVGGFFLGSLIFPPAIWSAFDMLYGFSDVEVLIDPVTALLSVVAALACSVGTTWFCCKNELVRMPASLMRPKSPKAGRRILLERIPFLWNNLGFLFKVSLRNIFRYKKRIVMMLLGVGGCTALVLTGFGLKDSISDIAEYQFDDIMKYDYTVSLGREYSGAEQSSFISQNSDLLESAVFVTQKNASVTTDEGIKNVNVVATDDESLSMLFDMHNGEESIPFPEKGQTVINVKIAELLGVGVGDTITLDFGDTRHAELYVSGVMATFTIMP